MTKNENKIVAGHSASLKRWAEQLRSPGRMSAVVLGGICVLWFAAAYSPLTQKMAKASLRLREVEARQQLASDVESLRRQGTYYQERLPRAADLNDWTQYVLTGILAEPVKLIRMDPKEISKLGPCRLLTWQIELEGDLESLGRVVAGLENGQRLVRVDRLVLQRANDRLVMSVVIRGLDM